MPAPTPPPDGLDLANPDETTQAEIDAFRAHYQHTKGYSLPAFEFWIEFRPDVLKRFRLGVRETLTWNESPFYPHILANLHYYAILGYADGVVEEMRACRDYGVMKAELTDTLAVAFLHAGTSGFGQIAGPTMALLRSWEEPRPSTRWPEGWGFEADAFRSGMDFTAPGVSARDLDQLRGWYRRTAGEVPRYVEFLARYRPGLLKAYRNRFEHAISLALPKQMMAYLLLHYHTARGFHEGIREAALLGRAMGMSRSQLIDAICWALYNGGPNAVSIADEAAGDVLDGMS